LAAASGRTVTVIVFSAATPRKLAFAVSCTGTGAEPCAGWVTSPVVETTAGFDDVRPTAGNVFPFVPPEGITVSALAERARVRKQTMTQAVEQLERAGYVERRPNPRDRRSRLVFLTERGASVPPVTHAAAEGVEGRWAELTSPEELEALRGSLLRLLGQLEDQPRGPGG